MATKTASIKGKYKNSPFKLRGNVTSKGVFFDRVDTETGDRRLQIHTTEKKARLLAQWILDNTEG